MHSHTHSGRDSSSAFFSSSNSCVFLHHSFSFKLIVGVYLNSAALLGTITSAHAHSEICNFSFSISFFRIRCSAFFPSIFFFFVASVCICVCRRLQAATASIWKVCALHTRKKKYIFFCRAANVCLCDVATGKAAFHVSFSRTKIFFCSLKSNNSTRIDFHFVNVRFFSLQFSSSRLLCIGHTFGSPNHTRAFGLHIETEPTRASETTTVEQEKNTLSRRRLCRCCAACPHWRIDRWTNWRIAAAKKIINKY